MLSKQITPGIYDISNDEYHASEGISRSAISELKKSPLHYYYRYLSHERPPQKQSSAMAIGSAVHTLVLEPNNFNKEFAIMKEINLRTKAGREAKEQFKLESAGKIFIKEEEFNTASAIAQSILEHSKTQKLLQQAMVEKSIYWVDEETDLLCKARPDVWNPTINIICDLKTSNDPSPDAFVYAVKRNDYHIQAAMQVDGVLLTTGEKIDSFTFIAAPNEPPYKPYFYVLPDEVIEQGRREYKDALKILKKCFETNKWDVERECVQSLVFSEYSLNINPLHRLMEAYHV
jgi:hypothetical protein